MHTNIRTATIQDAEGACRVIRASITDCCQADHRNDPEALSAWLANKTPSQVRSWIQADGAIGLAAWQADRMVGFALVSGGELALCYVLADVLHQGVGKALLREALTRARSLGMDTLRLDSTRTALPFYLRNGFTPIGPPLLWAGLEAQPMTCTLPPATLFAP